MKNLSIMNSRNIFLSFGIFVLLVLSIYYYPKIEQFFPHTPSYIMRPSTKYFDENSRCDMEHPYECGSGLCMDVNAGLGVCAPICNIDLDCPFSGSCKNNTCTNVCSNNNQCPMNSFCAAAKGKNYGYCTEPLPDYKYDLEAIKREYEPIRPDVIYY